MLQIGKSARRKKRLLRVILGRSLTITCMQYCTLYSMDVDKLKYVAHLLSRKLSHEDMILRISMLENYRKKVSKMLQKSVIILTP